MYLQITTKCNMACEHCCFKCRPGKGGHMSMEVFEQAIKLMTEYESHITIGGGEPTLHPHFEEILLRCIAASEESPFIVTNGSNTKRALMLHALAKRGVIDAHLSTDSFHDRIDDRVYEAFGWDDWNCEKGNGPQMVGRYAETNDEPESGCACETLFIQPDGKIRQCGCLDSPVIGDVWSGIDNDTIWGECYKDCEENYL